MADHELLVRRLLAALPIRSLVPIERGWDSAVFEVNGEWIVRVPRRAEVKEWLGREAALLPGLAAALPVPVPRFEIVRDSDGVELVAYRKLVGLPIDAAIARGADENALAREAGAFLAALHRFPRSRATELGIADVDATAWLAEQRVFGGDCASEVFPLLSEPERRRAEPLFQDFLLGSASGRFETAMIHADLGPEHILCGDSTIAGVIDWSDARIGDPALDFAWLLHGVGESFATALLVAYRGAGGAQDRGLRARALFYHRLGPWHEVLYGLQAGRPELVDSGLAGIRCRLP